MKNSDAFYLSAFKFFLNSTLKQAFADSRYLICLVFWQETTL